MLAWAAHLGQAEVPGNDPVVAEQAAAEEESVLDKLFDPRDGCFDLSRFLDEPAGFVPLVVPITEPALGGGAALVPIFIDQPEGGGRPNISAIGVMRTTNDSEALFGGVSRYFFDQRLKIVAGAADASINLDFYGLGERLDELEYNLDATVGILGGEWKLGKESAWRAGLRYTYAEVDASLSGFKPILPKPLFGEGINYVVSSLRTAVTYDSRDNVFTPTSGIVSDLSLTMNMEAIGGSSNYEVLNWTNLWFRPVIRDCLYFGIKAEIEQSFGDQPFYLRPYVKLRGAPAARYQGEGAASVEAELRWQFHPRWSLVGFGGAGATWVDESRFADSESTFTGGAGFRYLIARDYGLHMGCDLAYGEEGAAFYVQFGGAWGRL